MKKLVILGAGQQGRICKSLAESLGYKVVAFIDDNCNRTVAGLPVYRYIDDVPKWKKCFYFVAVGDISTRLRFIKAVDKAKVRVCNLIDKSLLIGKNVKIGKGNFIYKGTIIYDDVTIGDYNIINTQTLLAIDSVIGNNNNIGMGCKVCGGVKIGNNNYFGAQTVFVSGSKLLDRNTFEPNTVINGDYR